MNFSLSAVSLAKGAKPANRRTLPWLSLLLISSLLCLATPSHAEELAAGQVTHLSGTFSAKRPDGSVRVLGVQSAVHAGEQLATEADTYARIKFRDGSEVVLRPNTRFVVEQYQFDAQAPAKDNFITRLLKGGLRAVSGLLGQRSREKVEYRTTVATIGIRGTNHGMLLCAGDCSDIPTANGEPPPDGLHVDVVSGEVEVRNPSGRQNVGTGQFAFAANEGTPPVLVPASQGFQVTMPQSISQNDAGGRSVGGQARDTGCNL